MKRKEYKLTSSRGLTPEELANQMRNVIGWAARNLESYADDDLSCRELNDLRAELLKLVSLTNDVEHIYVIEPLDGEGPAKADGFPAATVDDVRASVDEITRLLREAMAPSKGTEPAPGSPAEKVGDALDIANRVALMLLSLDVRDR